MSETIGRLLAAGNVAEVFEWGSRVVKLYRSPARKTTAFREAAVHAAVEAMALPVPAVWGVLEIGGRWGIVFDRVKERSFAERMRQDPSLIPECLLALARLHARIHDQLARQLGSLKSRAGDKYRRYRASRRTAKADPARSPCRHARRRPSLSRGFPPRQRLGPKLAADGDRLA